MVGFFLFFNKISNLFAAIVGTIELSIPIIKEVIVDLIRICGVVFYWTDFDEKVIEWLNEKFLTALTWFETTKEALLKAFKRPKIGG